MSEEIKDKVYLLPNIGTAQEFISELINVLEKEHEEFSTHSMNEGALFLQGQKDMLGQIITMLKKERQDKQDEQNFEEIAQMKGTLEELDNLTIRKPL